MSNNTMYLYLIQDPSTAWPDDGNAKEAVRNMKKYYKGSIYIKSIYEFISQVLVQTAVREKLIKKLIIGAHGFGYWSDEMQKGYGSIEIGSTKISADDKEINLLKSIAHCFVKDAEVYLMSCRVGHLHGLMRQISVALGGIKVYGYTDYVRTTNYGLFVHLDNGKGDDGEEIVCLPGGCREN